MSPPTTTGCKRRATSAEEAMRAVGAVMFGEISFVWGSALHYPTLGSTCRSLHDFFAIFGPFLDSIDPDFYHRF